MGSGGVGMGSVRKIEKITSNTRSSEIEKINPIKVVHDGSRFL